MINSIGVTEAREKLSEIVDQVQHKGETFIIRRHGKPAAAVVPVKVLERWQRERELLIASVRTVQQENKDADPEEVIRDVLEAQQATRSKKRS